MAKKYTLYHPEFGYFETDLDVMEDRKCAEGWTHYKPVEEDFPAFKESDADFLKKKGRPRKED